MTAAEVIQRAIDSAVAGSDPDPSVVQKHRQEAETLISQALNQLAADVAQNPDVRHRLEASFSVSLDANGVGTIPAGLMTEYLHEGSVRDSDTGANNGKGNPLCRVRQYRDFVMQSPFSVFGYYCLVDNQFQTKLGNGDFTSVIGPLQVDAPFIPVKDDISTDVPDEITDDLVDFLAMRLRGLMRLPIGMRDIPYGAAAS